MDKFALRFAAATILISSNLMPSFAEDEQHYLSIVPRTGAVLKQSSRQGTAASKTPAKAAATGTKPKAGASANQNNSKTDDSNAAENPAGAETNAEGAATTAPRSFYSAPLEEAVKAYRGSPAPQTYSQMLDALKNTLAGAGAIKLSPAVLVKDNPYLADFKPRVIDTNGVRLWGFPKAPDRNRVLVQWYDTHQTIIGTGRRKRVVTSSAVRFQDLALAQPVNLKDAGMVSSKEGGRRLLLAGDADDGSLSVQAFKLGEAAGWVPSPEYLSQLPAFLTTNVTGRIGFRGADLIFNVGKMIQTTDSNGVKRFLPEAESATYKFLLKSTENGYVVVANVADEEAFSGVFQFMQAVQGGRLDQERALLIDDRLASLPKYLGLQGKPLDSAVRVVEMYVPPARGQRFRLINVGKDDLIFDVGKVKGLWQIKALFIAPPDAYLAETSKYFPLYSSFAQKSAAKLDSSDSPDNGGAAGGAIKKR